MRLLCRTVVKLCYFDYRFGGGLAKEARSPWQVSSAGYLLISSVRFWPRPFNKVLFKVDCNHELQWIPKHIEAWTITWGFTPLHPLSHCRVSQRNLRPPMLGCQAMKMGGCKQSARHAYNVPHISIYMSYKIAYLIWQKAWMAMDYVASGWNYTI